MANQPRPRLPRRRRRTTQRRFPRLKILDIEARLQVRACGTRTATEAPSQLIKAQIRDLSPEGACLEIDRSIVLEKRDGITLRLNIGSAVLDIPASLAWSSPSEGGVIQVGLQLRLEMAPVLVRTQYARFIVNAIQASG